MADEMMFNEETGDAAIIIDGHLVPVMQGEPCSLCGGSGMIVQPDGSVAACPKSPGPGHY